MGSEMCIRDRFRRTVTREDNSETHGVRFRLTYRKATDTWYGVYFVATHNLGRSRLTFQVGPEDTFTEGQKEHARRTAFFCRELYERHVREQKQDQFPFDLFKRWREQALYQDGQPLIDFARL